MPNDQAAIRYRPPWLWIVPSLLGFITARLPPHIWLDDVLLVLSAVLALAVVIHTALWLVAWICDGRSA